MNPRQRVTQHGWGRVANHLKAHSGFFLGSPNRLKLRRGVEGGHTDLQTVFDSPGTPKIFSLGGSKVGNLGGRADGSSSGPD